MARALIVGCGCRGRGLGAELAGRGWQVRGTSRTASGTEAISDAGLEAAVADPAWPGSVLELVADVAVLIWLLGSASGAQAELEAIHGSRLRSLLERLVDTPVRGFVYEAAGSADPRLLEGGCTAVAEATARWRIRSEAVSFDPADRTGWIAAMAAAAEAVLVPG